MNNSGLGEQLNVMKIRGMKIVLTLQRGTFNSQGANTKTIYSASLPGFLHIDVALQRLPAWQGNSAMISIYGMTLEDCFSATKFNSINVAYYNQVQIFAGYLPPLTANRDGSFNEIDVTNAIDQLPIVFLGQILTAAPNLNNVNRPFIIQAVLITQALATMGSSLNNNVQTNLSTVIKSIINSYNSTLPQIEWQLNNVYPDQQINNAHYTGSPAQQLQSLCADYGYQIRVSFPNLQDPAATQIQTLDITKTGTAPPNSPIDILNSSNGMIGYPNVAPFGIQVREYFNPLRSINDQINLQTYFTPIDSSIAGNYFVWQILSILQTHGDEWESQITLYGFNNSAYA